MKIRKQMKENNQWSLHENIWKRISLVCFGYLFERIKMEVEKRNNQDGGIIHL
jgi:hypothetical protein